MRLTPSIPSFILKKILKSKALRYLEGIPRVSLCGKAIRRTGASVAIFDSFCGITLTVREKELQEEVDRSISENYLLNAECEIKKEKKTYLEVISLKKATFQEEMYKTLESIELWNKVLFQKQPK